METISLLSKTYLRHCRVMRYDFLKMITALWFRFKENSFFEKCFLLPEHLLISLEFRISNRHIPVATGRWSNISIEDTLCAQ